MRPVCWVDKHPAEFIGENRRFFCGGCAGRMGITRRITGSFDGKDPAVMCEEDVTEAVLRHSESLNPVMTGAYDSSAGDILKQHNPQQGPTVPDSFGEFMGKVNAVINRTASEKGYTGEDEGHLLMKFVEFYFPGHALGEVVYKAVRYKSKGDPVDLVKIAAWAYLVWRQKHPVPAHNPDIDPRVEVEAGEFGALVTPVMLEVAGEAGRQYVARPRVRNAPYERLVSLTAEEAGEATKASNDMARSLSPGTAPLTRDVAPIYNELIQTAAMAMIAAAVIRDRHPEIEFGGAK